ncbi:MAG: cation transporting ATPase C-terminal domain-containing protein, partial [Acetivibrionales bacterium]
AQGLGGRVIYQGVVIAILTLISFIIGYSGQYTSVVLKQTTAMTMAFLTLSTCEIFHSINLRSSTRSIFTIKTHNIYLLLAMLASFVLTLGVIYIPGLNTVFELTALSLTNFLIAVGLSVLIIPIVEIEKTISRKYTK